MPKTAIFVVICSTRQKLLMSELDKNLQVTVQACNPHIQEGEARGLRVQSLGYVVRPYFKNKRTGDLQVSQWLH